MRMRKARVGQTLGVTVGDPIQREGAVDVVFEDVNGNVCMVDIVRVTFLDDWVRNAFFPNLPAAAEGE